LDTETCQCWRETILFGATLNRTTCTLKFWRGRHYRVKCCWWCGWPRDLRSVCARFTKGIIFHTLLPMEKSTVYR
jgi:hypothetical protein